MNGQTTAAQVAEILGDGQTFKTPDGRSLEELCEERGAIVEYARTEVDDEGRVVAFECVGVRDVRDLTRYWFKDGSAIILADVWDVEGSEPWSFAGLE